MSFVHNPTFGHPSDVFSKIGYPPLAVAFGLGTCPFSGPDITLSLLGFEDAQLCVVVAAVRHGDVKQTRIDIKV
jgi:hypothetical protein